MARGFSQQDAAIALHESKNRTESRQQHLETFENIQIPHDHDEVDDSPSPVYDAFHSLRSENGIQSMTNFTAAEFEAIWSSIAVDATAAWKNHRGARSKQTAKDVFFMMLSVFKTGGKWSENADRFKIGTGTFQKMIVKFIGIASPLLYNFYVQRAQDEWTMRRIVTSGRAFTNYPSALYATDVTFQETSVPVHEPDTYYSQKHKLHGMKVEVSVLPNGLAVNCSRGYPGTTADITIFRRNMEFHHNALAKKPGVEEHIPDDGPRYGSDAVPQDWAVLVDKGYVGLRPNVRAIHPAKKPVGSRLTPQQEAVNRRISTDRIIVENFFGRLCSLWIIGQQRYRWEKSWYTDIFKALVALTNANIQLFPLRAEDGEVRELYLKRMYALGVEAADNRKRSRRRARNLSDSRRELSANVMPAVSGLDSDDERPPRRRQRTSTSSYDSDETQM